MAAAVFEARTSELRERISPTPTPDNHYADLPTEEYDKNCTCGQCPSCVEDERWERIRQENQATTCHRQGVSVRAPCRPSIC